MRPENILRIVVFGVFAALAAVCQAQTQAEMTMQAGDGYKKADAKLNEVYKNAMAGLDEEGRGKLRAAQRAWVAYRDAQATFYADFTARGGSIQSMEHLLELQRLTEERVDLLQGIVDAQANR